MACSRRNWLALASAAAVLLTVGGGGAVAEDPASKPELPPLSERVKTHEALRLLAGLGYEPGTVDRMMTTNLAGAIEAFQRSHGLPVDGKVTDGLLTALRNARQ